MSKSKSWKFKILTINSGRNNLIFEKDFHIFKRRFEKYIKTFYETLNKMKQENNGVYFCSNEYLQYTNTCMGAPGLSRWTVFVRTKVKSQRSKCMSLLVVLGIPSFMTAIVWNLSFEEMPQNPPRVSIAHVGAQRTETLRFSLSQMQVYRRMCLHPLKSGTVFMHVHNTYPQSQSLRGR